MTRLVLPSPRIPTVFEGIFEAPGAYFLPEFPCDNIRKRFWEALYACPGLDVRLRIYTATSVGGRANCAKLTCYHDPWIRLFEHWKALCDNLNTSDDKHPERADERFFYNIFSAYRLLFGLPI